MRKVILEVGHGPSRVGIDPGAIGPDGVTEWSQCLVLASYVRNILSGPACEVYIADGYIENPTRWHADNPCDVFVSLHLNAFNRIVQGGEVLVRDLGDVRSAALARSISDSCYDILKVPNRGVKQANIRVLSGAVGAACLVEPFFIDAITSRAELAKMLVVASQGIARGITNYFSRR